MSSIPLLLRVSLLLSLALAATVHAGSPPAAYVDLIHYPRQEANWDRFFDLERRLERGFDHVCGDTFCEGEFFNYRPLQLRCSVHAATGHVHQCRWIFAASNVEVERNGGGLLVDARTWACALPIPPHLSVDAFHEALDGPDPIESPLPGGVGSVYDSLTGCLD